MRQTILGSSGLSVGAIAYGCWRFADESASAPQAKIEAALDNGLTLIDTADIYGYGSPAGFGGAEALLGEVLRASPGLRARMVLATKGGIVPPTPYDSSYDYLMGACEASLRRLSVDVIDLYQIHRPDLLAPMSETARALNDMVKKGKVRFIGVSNFTVSQTRALQAHLEAPLVSTQPEFSAICQAPITDGTLDWCSETGAACLAWSPLGGGALLSEQSDHPHTANIIETLDRLAEDHKATRSQVALAFTLAHPANVIPIIGTQTPARIEEAAKASEITLSRRNWYDLIEAFRGVPMP